MTSLHLNLLFCFAASLPLTPLAFSQSLASQETSEVAEESLPEAPSSLASAMRPQVASSAATQHELFPSFGARRKAYLYDLLGPGAFVGPVVAAGFDQARSLKVAYPPNGFNAPGKHPAHGAVPEWDQGVSGYSKRYASNFGIGLIGTTSRYALGEILRQDVTYHPCTCTGLFSRASHAVGQAFLAHTRSGRAVPSLPALASPFIASEVAVVGWYPARYNASDALRISAPLYVGVPLKNLLAEFMRR